MGTRQLLPQARQEDLLIQELPDETLVYDMKRHKAHCLNQTAALIWQHCDGQTTVAEITAILEQRLGAPLDEKAVWFAVDGLGKARLLQEKIAQPAKMTGVSRREVIRRLGIGAAIAAPLIMTIVAPKAAHAASCVSNCNGVTNCTPCFSGAGNVCNKVCKNGNCVGNC